jgi:hypothetical protein
MGTVGRRGFFQSLLAAPAAIGAAKLVQAPAQDQKPKERVDFYRSDPHACARRRHGAEAIDDLEKLNHQVAVTAFSSTWVRRSVPARASARVAAQGFGRRLSPRVTRSGLDITTTKRASVPSWT